MSVTYLLRHGRTALSATYTCTGDSHRPVGLDEVGLDQCRRLAATGGSWIGTVKTVVTSEFLRARQTASLLIGSRAVTTVVERRLNEIDYGDFEAGAWLDYGKWLAQAGPTAVVPGGRETWVGAVDRQLVGLTACLDYPGPRLVVAHGLLVSVFQALRNAHSPVDPLKLSEARYVQPVVLRDENLRALRRRWSSVGYARTQQVLGAVEGPVSGPLTRSLTHPGNN